MIEDLEEIARRQLRERLGTGARFDCNTAPAHDLLMARRGTAFFARKLNELTDGQLDVVSLMPGWTRRHVVAHVGYHARGLARLVKVAREGGFREEVDPDIPLESVDHGATLPAHALRYLFQHSAVHLNVEWRDLTGIGWRAHVQDLESRTVEISRTPMRRALEIWRCALALNNGAAIDDVPRGLSSALLRDSDVP